MRWTRTPANQYYLSGPITLHTWEMSKETHRDVQSQPSNMLIGRAFLIDSDESIFPLWQQYVIFLWFNPRKRLFMLICWGLDHCFFFLYNSVALMACAACIAVKENQVCKMCFCVSDARGGHDVFLVNGWWVDQYEAKGTTCTVVYHNHSVDVNSTHTVIFVCVHVWINSRQNEN